jgi:hypothetical protein
MSDEYEELRENYRSTFKEDNYRRKQVRDVDLSVGEDNEIKMSVVGMEEEEAVSRLTVLQEKIKVVEKQISDLPPLTDSEAVSHKKSLDRLLKKMKEQSGRLKKKIERLRK